MAETFFRAVGLKAITSIQEIVGLTAQVEEPKIAIKRSHLVASTRAAVHILPVTITLLLISVNTVGLLYGPELTAGQKLALQLASKLHELAIVGSLSTVVLAMVRHNLLNNGVNLGLLVSPFAFSSLSFLWSPEFASGFVASISRPRKLLLSSVVVIAAALTATVGPASAVLFLPRSIWLHSAGTEFYLRGPNDLLWPMELTEANIGPASCHGVPTVDSVWCPFGGYQGLVAHMSSRARMGPQVNAFDVATEDRGPPRVISGAARVDDSGRPIGREPFAYTGQVAFTYLLQDLAYKYGIALRTTKGQLKRFNNYRWNAQMMGNGRIPVARTVCGPLQEVRNDTTAFSFPVLEATGRWGNTSNSTSPELGLLKELNVTGLGHLNLTTDHQARAKWVTLPDEFGAATAGMVSITQNQTSAYSRACVVDSRWARGVTWINDGTIESWQTNIGGEKQIPIEKSKPVDFFDFLPDYSEPIRVDQDWLDRSNPLLPSSATDEYTMTTFEAMINTTALNDINECLNDESLRVLLEYATALHFVDALSRTGLSLQLAADSFLSIDPILQANYLFNDKMLHGGPVFTRPNSSIPTIVRQFDTYHYGNAWQVTAFVEGLSIAVLAVHFVIAFIHTLVLVATGRSSDTWDSIAELVALAYNSAPRSGGLRNCGAGIKLLDTLKTKMRVVAVTPDTSDVEEKLELVIVEDREEGGLRLIPRDREGEANEAIGGKGASIKVGKKYV